MIETSLLGVFLIGLFGGVHCAGMCGGIVAALGLANARMVAAAVPESGGELVVSRVAVLPRTVFLAAPRILAFNLARVSTYVLLGVLAGAVGSVGFVLDHVLPVQQTALMLANAVLIVAGLYIIGIRRITHLVESAGRPVWKRLQPHAARALARPDAAGLMLAGALWGLVPCGLVYTVLIASLTTGSPLDGGLMMGAFGLGTLPNLVLMGVSATWLARLRNHRGIRYLVGGLMVLFGLAGLLHIDAVLDLPLIGELCFHPVQGAS